MAFAGAAAVIGGLDAILQQLQNSQAQVVAMLHQLQGAQAQLQAAQAQMQLQMTGALAAHGLVSPDQRCAAARRANAVVSDAPFVLLPLADGSAPPAWPAGMGRAALRQLGSAAATALLADFGLATGGNVDAKRVRLASFIGAAPLAL